jgi:hypothetical protein
LNRRKIWASLPWVSPGAEKPLFFDAFRAWVDAGKFGQMAWLKKASGFESGSGKAPFKDCRTIISLAYPYSSTAVHARGIYRSPVQ